MLYVRPIAVLAIVCGCTGCFPTLSPIGPREGEIADLPIEVALVEQMGSQFEQEPDHPLLTVDFGTVVDDLGSSDGCWGAYTSREDSLVLADAEFFRFDLQQMEMTHQILQRGIADEDAVGLFTAMNFDMFTENVYSIESIADDHITVLWLSGKIGVSSNWLEAFEELTSDPFPPPPPSGVAHDATDVYILLQEDALRVGSLTSDSTAFRANRVFTRFECPDA